ncbi:MAG TPA: MarR family transcriptional regulator [Solirubrobacteraceae bacterium]|nr:MarR family transcriptional regulator [Solirubrobacteraceae bacterium]
MSVNPQAPSAIELDRDLRALVEAIRPVIGALKRSGPPPELFHEAFACHSLGPRHGPVLITVALEGVMSVSEIAERLDLSLSTTSLLVGELSRAGLLERTEDDRDRRRTLVRLPEAYRAAADQWLQERLGPLRRTLARLTPQARAGFIEGWRILREEIATLGVDAPHA